MFLSFTAKTLCQHTNAPAFSKEYYLQKSKNQRTAAWVLLGGGTAMLITGSVIAANAVANDLTFVETLGTQGSPSSGEAAGAFAIVGLTADLVSIPLFISASSNKHRAKVAIANQTVYLPPNTAFAVRATPALKITIGF